MSLGITQLFKIHLGFLITFVALTKLVAEPIYFNYSNRVKLVLLCLSANN